MRRRGPQQGGGNADVVVVVAGAGQHRAKRFEGGADQLPRGGLAGRAGDRHHRHRQSAPPLPGQLLVGQQRVVDRPGRQPWRERRKSAALDHGGLGTQPLGLSQEIVAIEALPHQGHEQVPGGEGPAVGADGPERRLRIERFGGELAGSELFGPDRWPPQRHQLAQPHALSPSWNVRT